MIINFLIIIQDNMKKKWIVIVCVVIVLAGICGYMFTKEKWQDGMEAYGDLNIMKMDQDLSANEGTDIFPVSGKSDIRINAHLLIAQGQTTVRVYFNNELIVEKTYEAGEHSENLVEISNTKGEVRIEYTSSDDVRGTYSFKVQTRQNQYRRLFRKIEG